MVDIVGLLKNHSAFRMNRINNLNGAVGFICIFNVYTLFVTLQHTIESLIFPKILLLKCIFYT